ncbi:MAG: NUDIX domain-containing protein [Myxococcota bacterium]
MEKPRIRVVVAEIEQDGQYLITQRRPEAVLPLLWEFPGGRVAPGETDHEALDRCMLVRLGVSIDIQGQTVEVEHAYADYVVILASYRVVLRGTPENRRVHDHRWVAPGDFGEYTFPDADQQTIDQLLRAPL